MTLRPKYPLFLHSRKWKTTTAYVVFLFLFCTLLHFGGWQEQANTVVFVSFYTLLHFGGWQEQRLTLSPSWPM